MRAFLAFFAAVALLQSAVADIVVYPAKGQSEKQMDKDKYECHNWAKKQTGFDPQTATPPQSGVSPSQGGPNAARGAAGGAAIGAITGNPGAGAAVGAGVGGARRRRKEHAEQQQSASEQQAYQQQMQKFEKAQGTCLEGRGYSVS